MDSKRSAWRRLRGGMVPALILALGAGLYAATFRPQNNTAASPAAAAGAASERPEMPGLRMEDLNGETWDLSKHRGKVVVVNFWATWCPPCRAETPDLVNVANRYREQGLEMVGISLDTDGEGPVRDFVRRYEIPYPVLMGVQDVEIASAIQSLPTTFLVDRQGRVARTFIGAVDERTLRAEIEPLLAE